MSFIPTIAQALPVIIRAIPAIAAGEITLSAGNRFNKNLINSEKLSSELGAAALYTIACVTPLPGVAAVATTIFVGYSLINGSKEDAYLSSKAIYVPVNFLKNSVITPVIKRVAKVAKFVWKHTKNVVLKVKDFAVSFFTFISNRIVKPFVNFAYRVTTKVLKFAKDSVLKPIVKVIEKVAGSIFRGLKAVFRVISNVNLDFFKKPRWALALVLVGASLAYSR